MSSSLLSLVSTRFAHEAHVMPPICNSIPVLPVLTFSVVMVLSFPMLPTGPGASARRFAAAALASADSVDHQRRGVHLVLDLEVQVQQIPPLGRCGGFEDDFGAGSLSGLGRIAVR